MKKTCQTVKGRRDIRHKTLGGSMREEAEEIGGRKEGFIEEEGSRLTHENR